MRLAPRGGGAATSPPQSRSSPTTQRPGETPSLCSVCPKLEGHLSVTKERSGTVAIGMDLSMSIGCFELGGSASFDTSGGLTEFSLFATNPFCFVTDLLGLILDLVPGASVFADALNLGVEAVGFGYASGPNLHEPRPHPLFPCTILITTFSWQVRVRQRHAGRDAQRAGRPSGPCALRAEADQKGPGCEGRGSGQLKASGGAAGQRNAVLTIAPRGPPHSARA